jgi:hypothetical protein
VAVISGMQERGIWCGKETILEGFCLKMLSCDEVKQRYIIRCTKYEYIYGQGKTQVFGRKPVSVPLCPPKITQWLSDLFEIASQLLMGAEILLSVTVS